MQNVLKSLTKISKSGFIRAVAVLAFLAALLASPFAVASVHAQGGTCPVNPNSLGGQPYVTVKLDQSFDLVNIRSGPNSMLYDKVGFLLPGESAPALGRTAGGDWIQIACPGVPGGVGWLYSANVDLVSSGILQEVEVPPTPEITLPFDSTMAAALQFQPTATRLPTFTPPAPTQPLPVYTDMTPPRAFGWSASLISGLALAGAVGLLFSFLFRR
ncbi:MAG: hypothetical protein AB1750_11335 [Chloroflexota bacterium]